MQNFIQDFVSEIMFVVREKSKKNLVFKFYLETLVLQFWRDNFRGTFPDHDDVAENIKNGFNLKIWV